MIDGLHRGKLGPPRVFVKATRDSLAAMMPGHHRDYGNQIYALISNQAVVTLLSGPIGGLGPDIVANRDDHNIDEGQHGRNERFTCRQ